MENNEITYPYDRESLVEIFNRWQENSYTEKILCKKKNCKCIMKANSLDYKEPKMVGSICKTVSEIPFRVIQLSNIEVESVIHEKCNSLYGEEVRKVWNALSDDFQIIDTFEKMPILYSTIIAVLRKDPQAPLAFRAYAHSTTFEFSYAVMRDAITNNVLNDCHELFLLSSRQAKFAGSLFERFPNDEYQKYFTAIFKRLQNCR